MAKNSLDHCFLLRWLFCGGVSVNSIFYRRFSLLLSLTTIAVLGRGFSAQAETVMVPNTTTNTAALAPQLAPASESALKVTQADINTEPSPGVNTTPSPGATDLNTPTTTGASSFTDVTADYWAEPFIQALAARNVIAGFPDATFKPEQPVTRAEFAAMIQKAFPQNSVQRQLTGGFSDVPTDYWAASAIWAQEKLERPIARIFPCSFNLFRASIVSAIGTNSEFQVPAGQWI